MNYEQYISMTNGEKFNYFMDTRFPTNRTPEYWIKWENVIKNIEPYEISLNTLNYLVGKDNIEREAKKLFLQQPKLLKTIPILIASRKLSLDVLDFNEDNSIDSYNLDFRHPNLENIDVYVLFMKKSGLLDFLQNHLKQSLVDYVYGVEAGLDTNARKNRSGTQNEIILKNHLKKLVKKYPFCKFLTQPTANKMKDEWDVNVPEIPTHNKSGGRRYDGAVYNSKNNTITIIETNFYGGGGSKLKSVCGEFSNMYKQSLKDAKGVKFVWISDGPGWDTAKNPMREAFDVIPNLFNLSMIKNNYLNNVVLKK